MRSIKANRGDTADIATLRIDTSAAPQWTVAADPDAAVLLLLSDAELTRTRPIKVPDGVAFSAVEAEQLTVDGQPTVRLTVAADLGSEHRVRRTPKGLEIDFWNSDSGGAPPAEDPPSADAAPARTPAAMQPAPTRTAAVQTEPSRSEPTRSAPAPARTASAPTSTVPTRTTPGAPATRPATRAATDDRPTPTGTPADPIDARLPHSPNVPPFAIGVGDILSISVFGIEELSRETPVQPDGQINLPLVGRLPVAGRSLADTERAIAAVLTDKGLATDPQVFVGIDEYKSQGTFVQGAVEQPGLYQIPGGLRLIELLSTAGGLVLRDPSGQRILVIRTLEDGTAQRMEIDASALLAEGDFSLNVLVLPGDLVLVPEPTTIEVFVSGAVREPGVIEGKPGEPLTLLHAVTAAGGPTERARVNNVTILRRSESGEERIEVNLKRIQSGRAPDVELRSGDSVVVKEWFF